MSFNTQQLTMLTGMLEEEEGYRAMPYRCTGGKLTIGIGRNLEDRGITKEEAYHLLHNDVQIELKQLKERLSFFDKLDPIRQIVLVDMAFNLGITRLLGFKKTLAFIAKGDYIAAAKEMLDSAWARQVGRRANRLSEMMRSGTYHKLW